MAAAIVMLVKLPRYESSTNLILGIMAGLILMIIALPVAFPPNAMPRLVHVRGKELWFTHSGKKFLESLPTVTKPAEKT